MFTWLHGEDDEDGAKPSRQLCPSIVMKKHGFVELVSYLLEYMFFKK